MNRNELNMIESKMRIVDLGNNIIEYNFYILHAFYIIGILALNGDSYPFNAMIFEFFGDEFLLCDNIYQHNVILYEIL